jgi:CubicO group peptidase (beta-lactamase class C family)
MKQFFLTTSTLLFIGAGATAQNLPVSGNAASAPDALLIKNNGPAWWYRTTPSQAVVELKRRPPSQSEQTVIDKARDLLGNRPAKVIALADGDSVIYQDFQPPANADSLLYSYSIGKTVTSMAIGQAVCAGKIKLTTRVSELMPEVNGKALGNATVGDLLRMASSAAEPNADSTIFNAAQYKAWSSGDLDLISTVAEDRIASAASGVFSKYLPGEHFSYKSTDPIVLGIIGSRATGMPWSQWIQTSVLNPMGAAHAGLYVQDRQQQAEAAGGLRLRLDDWLRFGLWVKRSSKEAGCWGDYVRAAMTTQISNPGTAKTRKFGGLFDGYGYLTWTDNVIAPNTAWAVGYGGQRIGWDKGSDRMTVVFSNVENWMPEVYGLARDWNRAKP